MSRAQDIPSAGRTVAGTGPNPPAAARTLWISWNAHRRTTGLCAAWGIPLHVVRTKRKGPGRWIERAVRTLVLLRRERPDILFVQNPSLALSLLAIAVRPLFPCYLVVDAHNEGVRPFYRRSRFVRWLTRRVLKAADLTIVTNAALASDVVAAGGRPVVLPDALPTPSVRPSRRADNIGTPEVVVIATFMPDEPIAAIMEAAATMPYVRFAVSGAAARFHQAGIPLPPNVRLTGFLLDPAYWRLLAGAAVIVDLTLKPDCLVCGAYEGLALGKPLVLSDNPPTRELFGAAAVLTGNSPGEIASAVRRALAERERLAANARELRDAFTKRWPAQASAAWSAILAGATEASRARIAKARR